VGTFVSFVGSKILAPKCAWQEMVVLPVDPVVVAGEEYNIAITGEM